MPKIYLKRCIKTWVRIHKPFLSTFFILFSMQIFLLLAAFECNTTSDWLNCTNQKLCYIPICKSWRRRQKCNSSPDKHVFLYLFPDCLCIIIHFSACPTTILARVLCLFAQVCKRKNQISEPRFDLAVILVMSRYEHNALPVNSEQ